MTKKKRSRTDVEDLIARPWCYYCERDFDDLKILISHQKAKHFKCDRCNRRLNTAGGLAVHLSQVHKEQLQYVENAMESRKDAGIEIFGMEGIPDDVLEAHKQRVVTEFYKVENSRRAETGNPPPGGKAGGEFSVKRPKVETAEELKQRLAEHRAKREAEKLGMAQASSGANTPSAVPGAEGQTPTMPTQQQQPTQFQPMEPQQADCQPNSSFDPPSQLPPLSWPPGYGQPGFPHVQPPMPPLGYPPQPFSPAQQSPYGAPPQSPFGAPPHGAHAQSPPGGLTHSGVASAPLIAPRNYSLPPPAPGLPPRPAFDPPVYNRSDFFKMHGGRALPEGAGYPAGSKPDWEGQPQAGQPGAPLDESVEELIRSVKEDVERRKLEESGGIPEAATAGVDAAQGLPSNGATPRDANPAETQPAATHSEAPKSESKDKKKKKSSKEAQKLVYSDERTSPEEKMARKPKYIFQRPDATQFVLDEAGGAVTGLAVDQDTVLDAQNSH